MNALAVAVACWVAGALGALVLGRRPLAGSVGAAGAVAGGVGAVGAAIQAMTAPAPALWRLPWVLPVGAPALRLDPLAGVFLVLIATVGALCAVYGVAYLRHHAAGEAPAAPPRVTYHRHVGRSLAAYNVLLLSMAVVVTADDWVLFLIAWELMTLSSWALVVSDHDERSVRKAGLQYLIAGHLATAALLVLALALAAAHGNFVVATGWPATTVSAGGMPRGVLFLLALVGFGTKAGIVPMHVWLPDAHPAAPSHVSALMSAVMITMGFYGLARVLPLLGPPAAWWGYLLLVLGAAGAVGGILFALAQRDVKRVLAYSTVENAGIVALAMGVGVLGTALGHPGLAGLAWTAALFHLWNHAVAKTLLFLGFGAVAQGVGSRSLDALGGLLARWRLTGAVLVVASAAVAAVPGLNVFPGEWLLLRGLFAGALGFQGPARVALLGGVTVVAFTGGLAVACFARLVGIGMLGTPRTPGAAHASQPGWAMRGPMLVLASACVALAAVPDRLVQALSAAVAVVAPAADLTLAQRALRPVAHLLPLLATVSVVLLLLRRLMGGRAGSGAHHRTDATWGCGFASPTAAMQYSATSFAEPLTRVMQPLLRSETAGAIAPPGALWPISGRWASRTEDRVLAGVYQPLFLRIGRIAARVRDLHQARVTTSLLYIVVVMLVLLGLLFTPGAGA